MSHFRAFVANQVLLQVRAFWGLFCPDFYSDIEDFTQILCRYLPNKLAAKTSGKRRKSELKVKVKMVRMKQSIVQRMKIKSLKPKRWKKCSAKRKSLTGSVM